MNNQTKRTPKDEPFIKLVCQFLQEQPNSTRRDVIQEAAFELDVSTVTAARYIKKDTAKIAAFEMHGYRVRCKACEKGN
jgi:hypothetical protein